MTDRILNVEFPYFSADPLQVGFQGRYKLTVGTDYRELDAGFGPINTVWVNESKLDLSGYAREDLTVFFRNSFEQDAGLETVRWSIGLGGDPIVATEATTLETIIISSVPMNDSQLLYSFTSSPGFIVPGLPGVDWGNFNREHIIHGSLTLWAPDLTIASGSLDSDSSGSLIAARRNIFSSLEPTAADCLYCYRVLALSDAYGGSGTQASGISNAVMPGKRVLMSITTEKEPELKHMMRLKRSYELANQV